MGDSDFGNPERKKIMKIKYLRGNNYIFQFVVFHSYLDLIMTVFRFFNLYMNKITSLHCTLHKTLLHNKLNKKMAKKIKVFAYGLPIPY